MDHASLTAHAAKTGNMALLAECTMVSSLDLLHELQQHPQLSLVGKAGQLGQLLLNMIETDAAPARAQERA